MAYKKLKMNKRGLLARDYIIMIVMFSLFAGLGALIVSDIASEDTGYGVSNMSNPAFDSSYNKLNQIGEDINVAGNSTRTGLGKFLGSTDQFFSSTNVVIDMTFGSFTMVRDIFSSMTATFGIPPAIGNLVFYALITIMTTIIIFVVISSLTRSKL